MNRAVMQKISEAIRVALERPGVTYRSICERAELHGHTLSVGTLSRLSRGNGANLTLESLFAIAAGLGISATDLIGERSDHDNPLQQRARYIGNHLPADWAETWLGIGESLIDLYTGKSGIKTDFPTHRAIGDGDARLVRVKKKRKAPR